MIRSGEGPLDWPLVGILAGGAIVGAFLGSWLVRPEGPIDGLMLRRIFSFVLLGLAGLLFFKK